MRYSIHAHILGVGIAIVWFGCLFHMEGSYRYQLMDKVLHNDPVIHVEKLVVSKMWKVEYHLANHESRMRVERYFSDYHLAVTFEPDFTNYSSVNLYFVTHVALFQIYVMGLLLSFLIFKHIYVTV
jgi:hypothetical protein